MHIVEIPQSVHLLHPGDLQPRPLHQPGPVLLVQVQERVLDPFGVDVLAILRAAHAEGEAVVTHGSLPEDLVGGFVICQIWVLDGLTFSGDFKHLARGRVDGSGWDGFVDDENNAYGGARMGAKSRSHLAKEEELVLFGVNVAEAATGE